MSARFQFSLKWFIAFVLIVGGTCGWVAHKVNRKWRERAAVAALKSVEAEILYDWQLGDEVGQPPGPSWLRKIAGDDFFAKVASADLRPVAQHYARAQSLRESEIDELMDEAAQLENLSHLYLADNPLTDAGLTGIGGLKRLETLDLDQTCVGDDGMKQLGRLARLSWLRLRGTEVSDRGLADLTTLKRLNYLDLRDTSVTRAGVQRLRESLPTCRIVMTTGARPVTPEEFEELVRKRKLITFRSWDGKWIGMDCDTKLTFLPHSRVHMTEYGVGVNEYDGTYQIDQQGIVRVEFKNFGQEWPTMVLERDSESFLLRPWEAGSEFVMGNRGGATIPGGAGTYWPFRPALDDD